MKTQYEENNEIGKALKRDSYVTVAVVALICAIAIAIIMKWI